jgi:DNA-binding IclR family transcriptional regulator
VSEAAIATRGHTSNPTARVVAVLDHLAAHPDRPFGVSELARDLRMNKSTCLAVLSTLTETGYLIQHPTRRDFRLGPALVTAGRAVLARFPDLSAAHRAMAAGAADMGTPVHAVTLADDQIVVLEVIGRTHPFRGAARVGTRIPFTPPYGAGFVTWGDPALWSHWLDNAATRLPERRVAALRTSIAAANERGFLVTIEISADSEFHDTVERLRHSARKIDDAEIRALASARLAERGYLLDEIEPDATYVINFVQAPVLPSPRRSPLSLMAAGFGRSMSGTQIESIGRRLADTCRQVAHALNE